MTDIGLEAVRCYTCSIERSSKVWKEGCYLHAHRIDICAMARAVSARLLHVHMHKTSQLSAAFPGFQEGGGV